MLETCLTNHIVEVLKPGRFVLNDAGFELTFGCFDCS